MEGFLRQNLGKNAEITFALSGESVAASGRITQITEDTVVLEGDNTLTAGSIDEILLVRLVNAMPVFAQTAQFENANQTTEKQPIQDKNAEQEKGKLFSPSLRASC